MTDELTFEAYKVLVESQCRAMLDTMAFVATGDLDVDVRVPEGIEVLSELGIAFSFLVEDLRDIVKELRQSQAELEERVLERTHELQAALSQAQATQRRYIRDEWQPHTDKNALTKLTSQTQPIVTEAIRHQQVTVQQLEEGQAAALPITYADEVIGALSFSQQEATPWTAEDIEDVETIVEQVGLALENQRLFDRTQTALKETEDQATRLRHLSELGATLTQTTTMVEAFTTIGDSITKVVDNDRASIALVEPGKRTYQVFVLGGLVGNTPTGATGPLDGSTIEKAIQSQSIIINDDLSRVAADDDDSETRHQGMLSNLIAPLMVGGNIVGTLNLGSKRNRAFATRERLLVSQLASLLASTLENQRLLDEAQKRARREQLLREVTARIRSSSDVNTIMQIAAKEVGDALSHPTVVLLNPEQPAVSTQG